MQVKYSNISPEFFLKTYLKGLCVTNNKTGLVTLNISSQSKPRVLKMNGCAIFQTEMLLVTTLADGTKMEFLF